jgi:copper homeostasis protein
MKIIFEACVESLEQALAAQEAGAHRIELCSRLDLDGLSPSSDLIMNALEFLSIPFKPMVRPRAGDFAYEEEELRQMEREIEFCKRADIQEVVFGVSLPSGALDISAIRRLAEAAAPMRVTIHKAIDLSPDPLADMESMRPIANVVSILSSGKQPTALEGAPLLRKMIQAAGDRFSIIAAGKATRDNWERIARETGAVEIHGRRIVN